MFNKEDSVSVSFPVAPFSAKKKSLRFSNDSDEEEDIED